MIPFFPTECTLNEPGAVEGLQFYADLRWEHGFAPRPEALAEMGTGALMQTGRLAMIYNGSWAFPNFRESDFTVALGHYPGWSWWTRQLRLLLSAGGPQDKRGAGLRLELAEILQRSGNGDDHS